MDFFLIAVLCAFAALIFVVAVFELLWYQMAKVDIWLFLLLALVHIAIFAILLLYLIKYARNDQRLAIQGLLACGED